MDVFEQYLNGIPITHDRVIAEPYPNEHSARLQDPGRFSKKAWRRTDGGTLYGKIKVPKTIGIIWGKLKGKDKSNDPPIAQSLRFPTKHWTAAQAKSWLKKNKIKYKSFEPASKAKESTSMDKLKQFISALKANATETWKLKDSESKKRRDLETAVQSSTSYGEDWWVVEVFADVIIVRNWKKNQYFAVEYEYEKGVVTLGAKQEVEVAYIPKEAQEAVAAHEKRLTENDKSAELIEDVFFAPCKIEEDTGGTLLMRGLFVEADKKNDNHRIYPRDVVKNNIISQFKKRIVTGLDGHPPLFSGGKPGDTALKFLDAWMTDNGVGMCRAKILDTDAGRNIRIIAEEGIPIGLSLRGYGTQVYDEDKDANVIQKDYRLEGIDAVLTPAFTKARLIREEREKQAQENKEDEPMDPKLQEEITGLKTQIATLGESIKQLIEKGSEDSKIIAQYKADKEAAEKALEAKNKVAALLDDAEQLKGIERFKETLRLQLADCKTPGEVDLVFPKVKTTLLDMAGRLPEPEPTGVIVKENGFFGDKKIPNTIEEAYNWMLEKFPDTGVWEGISALNNPRYCADMLLENYIKNFMCRGKDAGFSRFDRHDIFRKTRNNPLFHLTMEAIGDAETYTGDVAATAAYLLPLYVITMQDMMNIVGQAVGIQPMSAPTGKVFFQKAYYGDGAGGWTEINQTNFSRTKAAKAEGAAPQLMKIKIASNNITLKTALKLMYEWTIEAQQDMAAYFGLNMDSAHLQEARREIMRELSSQILYALLTATSQSNSDNKVQATGSPLTYTLTNPSGWSKSEWLKHGLTIAVKQASALINKQPFNVYPDVIIVDSDYDYLFTEHAFVAEGAILTNFGFSRIGTFNNHYKVFTTTDDAYNDKILVTHRGSSFLEAAHAFLPFVLFWMGGLVEQNTGEFSRTVMSRFANEKIYGGKISIINIVP